MSTAFAYHPIEQKHNKPGHVENNQRTAEAMRLLKAHHLLAQMTALPVQPIARDALHRIHPQRYIQRLERLAARGGGMLDYETYSVPESFQAALMSAGAALAVVEAVATGQARNGISLMRPPGHHALAEEAMGYCHFANAALAARAAQHDWGLPRVLIIDWDVHHGNGTQDIFYQDPTVAFVSLHQFPLYPGTGAEKEMGAGPGRGFTLNIPMPAGVGDTGYLRAFDELIAPFARRFQPQLIIISSGFDTHWRDPLSQMGVSLSGYARLLQKTRALAEELCDGRLVILLEGGYHVPAVAYGVLNSVNILLGRDEAIQDPLGSYPQPETDSTPLIARLKRRHRL